jgi:hypothetical protein
LVQASDSVYKILTPLGNGGMAIVYGAALASGSVGLYRVAINVASTLGKGDCSGIYLERTL